MVTGARGVAGTVVDTIVDVVEAAAALGPDVLGPDAPALDRSVLEALEELEEPEEPQAAAAIARATKTNTLRRIEPPGTNLFVMRSSVHPSGVMSAHAITQRRLHAAPSTRDGLGASPHDSRVQRGRCDP